VQLIDLPLLVYSGALLVLCAYGLHRLVHLIRLLRGKRWQAVEATGEPLVLVQIPLFNERSVAARVIAAAASLDWPRQRLHIQVLDDSGDDTVLVVEQEVARWRERGVRIEVLRRSEREGFKAGALAAGLEASDAPFVAIFDADFMPKPDYLRRCMGAFNEPDVGLVQARWQHHNRDQSLFTRAQATLLDGHFVIEHQARFGVGLCFNFNGTAGIWRREAITDAGGWSGETLTEDLDLSYRSQMAGWRFVYAWDVVVPAELPMDAAAFLAQQARWARGSVQVLRKLGKPLAASNLPRANKLEAFGHLLGNAGQPALLALCLSLPFVAQLRAAWLGPLQWVALVLCTLSVILFYETSQRMVGRPLRKRVPDVLAAMALGIGLCVRQTRAVTLGLFGGRGVFERTPKCGAEERSPYRARSVGAGWIELCLAAMYLWTALQALLAGSFGALPFLGLFVWGFGWVGLRTRREARQAAPRSTQELSVPTASKLPEASMTEDLSGRARKVP
jgi:hypothetical protein